MCETPEVSIWAPNFESIFWFLGTFLHYNNKKINLKITHIQIFERLMLNLIIIVAKQTKVPVVF